MEEMLEKLTKIQLSKLCRLYIYEKLSSIGDPDFEYKIIKTLEEWPDIKVFEYNLFKLNLIQIVEMCYVNSSILKFVNCSNKEFSYSRHHLGTQPFIDLTLTDKGREVIEKLSIEARLNLIFYHYEYITDYFKLVQFLINKLPIASLPKYLVHKGLLVRCLAKEGYDKLWH